MIVRARNTGKRTFVHSSPSITDFYQCNQVRGLSTSREISRRWLPIRYGYRYDHLGGIDYLVEVVMNRAWRRSVSILSNRVPATEHSVSCSTPLTCTRTDIYFKSKGTHPVFSSVGWRHYIQVRMRQLKSVWKPASVTSFSSYLARSAAVGAGRRGFLASLNV